MSYQTNTKVQTSRAMPQKEKQKAFLQHLNIRTTFLQSQSKQVALNSTYHATTPSCRLFRSKANAPSSSLPQQMKFAVTILELQRSDKKYDSTVWNIATSWMARDANDTIWEYAVTLGGVSSSESSRRKKICERLR